MTREEISIDGIDYVLIPKKDYSQAQKIILSFESSLQHIQGGKQ